MQVNLVSTTAGGQSKVTSQTALLPDILRLLQVSIQAPTQREQSLAQREEKLRDRDAEFEEAVGGASTATRLFEDIIRAERNMLPGSHAARRQYMHDRAEQRATQQSQGFRQALTDAAGNGRNGPAQSPTPRSGNTTPADATRTQAGDAPAGDKSGSGDKPAGSTTAKPESQLTARPMSEASPSGPTSARPPAFAVPSTGQVRDAGDATTKSTQAVARVRQGRCGRHPGQGGSGIAERSARRQRRGHPA